MLHAENDIISFSNTQVDSYKPLEVLTKQYNGTPSYRYPVIFAAALFDFGPNKNSVSLI